MHLMRFICFLTLYAIATLLDLSAVALLLVAGYIALLVRDRLRERRRAREQETFWARYFNARWN